jgi:hypothetical protein
MSKQLDAIKFARTLIKSQQWPLARLTNQCNVQTFSEFWCACLLE